jgi:hypothetical protein
MEMSPSGLPPYSCTVFSMHCRFPPPPPKLGVHMAKSHQTTPNKKGANFIFFFVKKSQIQNFNKKNFEKEREFHFFFR